MIALTAVLLSPGCVTRDRVTPPDGGDDSADCAFGSPATTGADGRYTLPRMFAGTSTLRVIKGSQGAEIRFTIPLGHVTTGAFPTPSAPRATL
jgi:hypothetical protein